VDAYLFVYVPSGNVSFSEQGGSLLAVERADAVDGERLNVWQSTDGGQSWVVVGELPADVNGGLIASDDMLIGPDSNVGFAKTIIATNSGSFHHNGAHSAFGPLSVMG
ncbi:MAG: hypothetical protein QQN63_08225, partial [Nitrosopumilus sp.]